MSFRLKNSEATFQCLVSKNSKDQIDKTMKVYNNDMITKLVQATDRTVYLRENFELLWKYKMRLNLEKCVFGVIFE